MTNSRYMGGGRAGPPFIGYRLFAIGYSISGVRSPSMRILLLALMTLCPLVKLTAADKYPIEEGFADANGLPIYYMQVGVGEPLVILHGGPGASHEYLLPLARNNRLIFIDERGSGRSQKIEDPSGYTVENMVEDVEGVRASLGLGKINLLGHSYGGVLAQRRTGSNTRSISTT
jgi:proline iminopeptidase